MDLRIERTRKSIINAFLELRAHKPIEKITVKELAELAYINKATFYSHYKDIYDLTEQLEDEAISTILKNIPHPEYIVTRPKAGFEELAYAMTAQSPLLTTLFSDSRASFFTNKLEQSLKEHIYALFPELKNNLEKDILLSVLIQGCFHAYASHQNCELHTVIDILGDINECLTTHYGSKSHCP